MTGVGYTLSTVTGKDRDIVILFQGICQVDSGSDTRTQDIAHQTGQFQDGAAFSGSAQVAFVGNPLLVEGQHICYYCPGIQEGNGWIVCCTGSQTLQGIDQFTLVVGAGKQYIQIAFGNAQVRQAGLHSFQKTSMSANTIDQHIQARAVDNRDRG